MLIHEEEVHPQIVVRHKKHHKKLPYLHTEDF